MYNKLTTIRYVRFQCTTIWIHDAELEKPVYWATFSATEGNLDLIQLLFHA